MKENGNGAGNGTTAHHLMTIREMAREAGVSPAAVARWIANNKLSVYRLPGSGKKQPEILRVARKDFEQFMKSCYSKAEGGV